MYSYVYKLCALFRMATTLTNQYKSHCAIGEIVTVHVGEEKK